MIKLHFLGPYSFVKSKNYVFDSTFPNPEGIYLWTIKDQKNILNYVHYIGETNSFLKRQKEHIIQIAGLNYRIIDAELAKQGIEKIIWNGMWRDKTKDAVNNLLENYNSVTKKVVDYISIINIYFSPTTVDNSMRKHIEGCLGMNLRSNYPELNVFYPNDNRVVVRKKRLGEKIKIETDDKISGIDKELEI